MCSAASPPGGPSAAAIVLILLLCLPGPRFPLCLLWWRSARELSSAPSQNGKRRGHLPLPTSEPASFPQGHALSLHGDKITKNSGQRTAGPPERGTHGAEGSQPAGSCRQECGMCPLRRAFCRTSPGLLSACALRYLVNTGPGSSGPCCPRGRSPEPLHSAPRGNAATREGARERSAKGGQVWTLVKPGAAETVVTVGI